MDSFALHFLKVSELLISLVSTTADRPRDRVGVGVLTTPCRSGLFRIWRTCLPTSLPRSVRRKPFSTEPVAQLFRAWSVNRRSALLILLVSGYREKLAIENFFGNKRKRATAA